MEASLIVCDYAQVWQGKLFVSGGGVDFVATQTVTPPFALDIFAACLITVPWEAHNQLHTIRVGLVSEDGDVVSIAQPAEGRTVADDDVGRVLIQFNADRAPLRKPGTSSPIPLAVSLRSTPSKLGAYTVVMDIDGTELAKARFELVPLSALGGQFSQ